MRKRIVYNLSSYRKAVVSSIPKALTRLALARFVFTALLFIGVSLGLGSTAFADVMVSNLGQTNDAGSALATYDQAQAFTTGSYSNGYTLTSVEIHFWGAGTWPTFTVKIHSNGSDGELGNELGTLTHPETLSADVMDVYYIWHSSGCGYDLHFGGRH